MPTVPVANLEFLCDISEVISALIFLQRKATAVEIQDFLEIPGFTLKNIEDACQFIEKNQLLDWSSTPCLSKKTPYVGSDNFVETDGKPYVGIEIHQKFAKNFMAFIEKPKSPSIYNSAFVQIRKSQFMPIAMQILELRNWILDISQSNQLENSSEECHLMQYDMNLFPLNKTPRRK